jgi:hypothetical protein
MPLIHHVVTGKGRRRSCSTMASAVRSATGTHRWHIFHHATFLSPLICAGTGQALVRQAECSTRPARAGRIHQVSQVEALRQLLSDQSGLRD